MNNLMILFTVGEFFQGAWEIMKNILIFVLVLGLIVGIHEFGHFIFARRAGILAREFAIGMGPKLWKKRKGETVYTIRAFPIGGFCSIAGEEVEDDPFKDLKEVKLRIEDGIITGFFVDVDDPKIAFPTYEVISYDIYDCENTGNLYMEVIEPDGSEELTKRYQIDPKAIIYQKKNEFQIAPYNRTIGSKKKSQRAMVMFGGPLMNFLLALLVFFIVGLFSGFANLNSTRVAGISETEEVESYPIRGYLKDGDQIVAFETATLGYKDLTTWTELSDYMKQYDEKNLSEDLTVTIERAGVTELIVVQTTLFIGINNAGFGSDFDYNKTGVVKVGVYQRILQDGMADNTLLNEGDIIKSIWLYGKNPITNPTWTDIRRVFDNYTGDSKKVEENKVYMSVERAGEVLEISVMPYSKKIMENQTTISGSNVSPTSATIGISPEYNFSLIKSIGYSFERTWGSFTAVIDTLKLLFGGTVSVKNLSGPIGIYSITSNAAQYGVLYVLSLIGLLSVNIGFLNLLPIPALDGGRLVFLGYEAVTKRKPNPKVETILIMVTMILLLGLMVFVAYEDIVRLING